MYYLLLIFAIFISALKSPVSKALGGKDAGFFKTMRTNVGIFFCAFLTVFLMGIKNVGTLFNVPWWLVICFAVCVLGSQIALMKAVEWGPVSLTSLFNCSGFIIPTLFGLLYYKEDFHFLQGVGLVMIFCSLALCVKKEKGKKFNFKWLAAALTDFLLLGLVGVWQKILANTYKSCVLDNFLSMVFLIVVLLSGGIVAVSWLCKRRTKKTCPQETTGQKKEETSDTGARLRFFLLLLLMGVLLGLTNKTNAFLAGVLPGVIVFPFLNGGVIVTTTLLSALLYKEKPSAKQWISILTGVAAIVVIAVGQAL